MLPSYVRTWKPATDMGKCFGDLLTDLWKPFDCFPHDFFPSELNTYGFNISASKTNTKLLI